MLALANCAYKITSECAVIGKSFHNSGVFTVAQIASGCIAPPCCLPTIAHLVGLKLLLARFSVSVVRTQNCKGFDHELQNHFQYVNMCWRKTEQKT